MVSIENAALSGSGLSTLNRVVVGVLAVALLALPFVLSGFQLFQITMMLVMSISILGLNLLVGYNGQLSLGHGAIFAIGAYTTALLMEFGGVPWWASIVAAGVVCLIFGFIFGWPALRFKGHHLALATFALAITMPQILKHRSIEDWTGGVQGLMLFRPSVPEGSPINDDQALYFVVLVVTGLMFLIAWNLLRGRIGRAMIAIREQPIAAAAMGINVPIIKATTFGVSAMFTGVSGALYALATQFVSPDSFGLMVSIFMLVGVVIGGAGTIGGALIGAAFVQFIPNVVDQISQAAPSAIYALVLLLTIYLMPNGVMGLLYKLARWVRKRSADPAGTAVGEARPANTGNS